MSDYDTKRRQSVFKRMKLRPQSFLLSMLFGAVVGLMVAGSSGLALGASLCLLARIFENDPDERFSDGGGNE